MSIDPNLMYRLGVVADVPVNCNPVIGLSFLKFGIIESWLTSSSKDSVVRLTNRLFTLENGAIEVIKISCFTPESIGHVLQIIETTQDTHDKLQQALVDYCKGLPEFKDVTQFSQDDIELLTLIPAALQYVDMNTVYPKGAVQALFLAYLCSISQTREDIQAYYRGFLNNPDFKLTESAKVPTVTKKSKKAKKEIVKDYFCSVSQTTELQKFIDSFAQKNKPYDALQNLVLLFFDYKDGNLVPNTVPSYLINYISVSHLGTMMRIIEQNNDPKVLMKKLGDYFVGLKILNRTTEEFLDEKSFNPLLVDISESVALTQGNNPKYRYDFFMSVLNSCICSRLTTKQDIKDYSEGFFVHATTDLIEQKEKEFACCISKKSFHQDQEHEEEDNEPWELEFEHGHHHEEAYYDISDRIVERTLLLDLEKKQVENSVESIIFQLSKVAYLQKKLQEHDKELNSNTLQAAFPLVGAFYTNKKRKERQDILNKEISDFNKVVTDLKNIAGIPYQRIESKKRVVIAISDTTHFNPKSEADNGSQGVFIPDKREQIIDLKGVLQITQSAGFKPSDEPLVKKAGNEIILQTNNQEQLLVPRSLSLVCSGMQPTIGNLALGLQKVLGLKIIPGKDIHLLLDPRVAAQYFNQICRKFNWKFDLSNFDINKPIELNIGGTEFTIDLNMQRSIALPLQDKNVQGTETEEKQQRISLPAAGMKKEKDSIVPSFSDQNQKLLLQESDLLSLVQNEKNSDSLVAAAIVTGTVQAQELARYKLFKNTGWFAGMSLILEKQRALFEFVSLETPKPYELVMSKLNEIMSNKELIKSNLVAYELQNFFKYPDSSNYRTGISEEDINNYFKHAPEKDLLSFVDTMTTVGDSSEIYKILETISKESLGELFERMSSESLIIGSEDRSIEVLLKLFKNTTTQEKINIFSMIPQNSLKVFIESLSTQEFFELFKNFSTQDMQKIKISDTQTVFTDLYQRINFYSEQTESTEHSRDFNIQSLRSMSANKLEQIALERQKAYEEWYRKSPALSEITQPHEASASRNTFIPTVRTPKTMPINYRRYLQPKTWRRYIAEHGREIAEHVVRSGIRPLV